MDKKKYIESYNDRSISCKKLKFEDLKNLENLNYTIPQSTGNTYIDNINVDVINYILRKILVI